MFLRFAPAIGLFAALTPGAMPVLAHAQTNIDQGKTPAQIFAQDCAACHKATRGLANGKNSLSLTLFLREHYTTSREQAAALAAYVLGAGGAEPAKPGQKPGQERAKNEDPKNAEPKNAEPKNAEPKTASRPRRPAAKPAPERQASHPAASEHEAPPPTATPGREKEPEKPAAVVSVPPPAAEAPKPEPKIETGNAPRSEPGQDQTPTTSAAAPAESESGDGAPVPRDNIPD